MLRVKAQAARWVLSPVGERPAGLGALENLARHRALDTASVAQGILVTLNEAGKLLMETEMEKDGLLAAIDRVETLQDVCAINDRLENRGNRKIQ